MSAGVPQRLWDVNDLVALWEAYEQRRAERAAHMNRTFEVVSGIGVLLLSLQGSAVIFQCIFTRKVPSVSAISLCISGAIVLLSYCGAFILLSWAKKPK
jgi:hypothetical protein